MTASPTSTSSGASDADRSPPPDRAGGEAREGSRHAAYRGVDRRRSPTSRISRWSFFGGRRRGGRRAGEAEGVYVDVYDTRLLVALMWVALTNVADSFFTMVHLQGGGSEANPIADLLLMTGRANFVLVKSILVALALIVLCVHKNFRVARIGLWVAAGSYTVLLAYHLLLFLL